MAFYIKLPQFSICLTFEQRGPMEASGSLPAVARGRAVPEPSRLRAAPEGTGPLGPEMSWKGPRVGAQMAGSPSTPAAGLLLLGSQGGPFHRDHPSSPPAVPHGAPDSLSCAHSCADPSRQDPCPPQLCSGGDRE